MKLFISLIVLSALVCISNGERKDFDLESALSDVEQLGDNFESIFDSENSGWRSKRSPKKPKKEEEETEEEEEEEEEGEHIINIRNTILKKLHSLFVFNLYSTCSCRCAR